MQKKISVWMTVMICAFGIVLSSMITIVTIQQIYNKKLYDERMTYGEIGAAIRDIDLLYRQYYPGELNADDLKNYAIKGYIVGTGDRHGYYYSPEEAKVLTDSMNGEGEGIGVMITYSEGDAAIKVESVTPGSPAEKSGVKHGDLITHIINDDGTRESVESLGYDVAVDRLKGEIGAVAKFVVLRDEDGDGVNEEKEFEVERTRYETISVLYHVYGPDNSIGVIQISGFEKNTPGQFRAAVSDLQSKGVKKLIFDVRNNPGGDKDSVCEILDYLLPEGTLLRTVDAEGNYTTVETSDEGCLDMPMAVVVNGNTASAGELFAAAIKDYGAGKLVGEKTYGKGSMQSIMPVFGDGSLLKVTTALYCPPVSENYDGVGITPDVAETLDRSLADIPLSELTDENDNQLRAAAEIFE